jgi:ABC-type nitrate/sulfonate/bicarbonate transport system substrate-binding protein
VRFAYGDKLHEKLGVNLDDDAVTALEQFKRYLLEWEFIQRDFDVSDWLDPGPLRSLGLS